MSSLRVQLTINDQQRELRVEAGETLLDALRTAGYFGVKRGCETGTCGSCVVLVDGVPRYSCLLFAAAQAGRSVTTVEALGTPDAPHPILEAFAREGAVQCGYCVPGMALSTSALLAENPDPTEDDARRALDGHLCRCTGYLKQIRAVLRAAEQLRTGRGGGTCPAPTSLGEEGR
jgi:aerobic-type carbon monoxide dehydrogenase small subunit (CoxS/CutS family)